MIIDIEKKLDEFLDEDNHTNNPTEKQKSKWIRKITEEVEALLDDTDIFYDNMPVDVDLGCD